MRILIVDDEELVARAMVRAIRLGLPAHYVDAAESGGEAMAMHTACAYAVAIIDVHLPDTNGPTLVRALRRVAPLRVVLMGGGDLEPFRGAGIATLEKPFTNEALLAAVARAARDLPSGAI